MVVSNSDGVGVKCWCGCRQIGHFGGDYGICESCGTLVFRGAGPGPQVGDVDGDPESGYYGKRYWFEHQQQDLGLPPLHVRARQDLTERNLHWLATLLRYRQPPARVLEPGCSHGSFVALMRQAGYDASGVEMSPAVVAYGQRTFGVPVQLGPVERLDLPAGSVDVIVMMDVLEHLPEPLETLEACSRLLTDDGLLLIQTPEHAEGACYERLEQAHSRFLSMMIPFEHLFLYSRASVSRLLKQIGLPHVVFEEAIFSDYDMFLVAGKTNLASISKEAAETALLATPGGRMVLAMLDLRARELALTERLAESEADRAARLVCIQKLEKMVHEANRASRRRGSGEE